MMAIRNPRIPAYGIALMLKKSLLVIEMLNLSGGEYGTLVMIS